MSKNRNQRTAASYYNPARWRFSFLLFMAELITRVQGRYNLVPPEFTPEQHQKIIEEFLRLKERTQ